MSGVFYVDTTEPLRTLYHAPVDQWKKGSPEKIGKVSERMLGLIETRHYNASNFIGKDDEGLHETLVDQQCAVEQVGQMWGN